MEIKKQTTYECKMTKEEITILNQASNIISDLIETMKELNCTYAGCIGEPKKPEDLTLKMIIDSDKVLRKLQNLQDIYEKIY